MYIKYTYTDAGTGDKHTTCRRAQLSDTVRRESLWRLDAATCILWWMLGYYQNEDIVQRHNGIKLIVKSYIPVLYSHLPFKVHPGCRWIISIWLGVIIIIIIIIVYLGFRIWIHHANAKLLVLRTIPLCWYPQPCLPTLSCPWTTGR